MKHFIIITLIAGALVACSNNKPTNDLSRILTVQNPANDGIFAEFFEIESIVPIETKDDFIISNIKKVIWADADNIIILDDKSCIFAINSRTGKAKFSIDKKGQAPGESKNICDITFDTLSRNIIVLNDYKKILFFDMDGKFLYEESVKKLYENIVYDRGNAILYNPGEGYGCYPYCIDVYNIQNKSWKHEGDDTKLEFPFRPYGRLIVKSKQIWFSAPLGYQIGRITEDYKFDFPYTLKTEKQITKDMIELATSNYMSFSRKIREEGIIYGISSIRETDNFLVFKTNRIPLLMMSKNGLTVEGYRRVFDKNIKVRLANYFPHDGDDNRIMFIVQPNEWKERETPKNIPPHIQSLVDSVKIEDDNNPILMFYKEKNKSF
ncbi:MAG: 6-bladed beta-propeller [Bacteroidales bacterium]|nr:6-bladed beta-propeller [Bacteroidales bacterium]